MKSEPFIIDKVEGPLRSDLECSLTITTRAKIINQLTHLPQTNKQTPPLHMHMTQTNMQAKPTHMHQPKHHTTFPIQTLNFQTNILRSPLNRQTGLTQPNTQEIQGLDESQSPPQTCQISSKIFKETCRMLISTSHHLLTPLNLNLIQLTHQNPVQIFSPFPLNPQSTPTHIWQPPEGSALRWIWLDGEGPFLTNTTLHTEPVPLTIKY